MAEQDNPRALEAQTKAEAFLSDLKESLGELAGTNWKDVFDELDKDPNMGPEVSAELKRILKKEGLLITPEPEETLAEQEYEPKQPFLGYDYNRFWTDRKSGRKSVKVGKQINNEEKGFSTNIPLPYNLKLEDNEERYRFFDNLTDARKQAYTAFNLPLEEGAEYALVQIRVFKRRKGSRSDAPLDPEAWVFVGSSDGKKEYEQFELPEAASVSQRNEDGEWEDQVVNVRDIVLKNPDGFLQDQVFKDWRTQEVRARHDAFIFKKLKELYPEWDFENAPKPAEIPPAPARVEPKVDLSPEQLEQQAMENDAFFSTAVGRAAEVAKTVRDRYQGDLQDFQATLVGMLVLFFRKLHESFRDQGILSTALDTHLSGIWAADVATSFSEPAPQVEPGDPWAGVSIGPGDPFAGVSADVDWGADIPAAPLREEPKVEISPAPLLAVWNTVKDRVEKPAQTSQIEERKYLGRLFRLAVREHVQELERLSGAKLTSEEFDKGQFVEDAVRFYHTLRHNATLTQDFDDNDIKEMLTDILDETLS